MQRYKKHFIRGKKLMGKINYDTLFIMLICNGTLFFILLRMIPKGIRRMYYMFASIPVFVYSGFGMIYDTVGDEYLFEYIIFSSVFMLTLCVVLNGRYLVSLFNRTYSNELPLCSYSSKNKLQEEFINNENELIYTLCTVVYFMTYIVFLFIPENRIYQLWNPPPPSIVGIYNRMIYRDTNSILSIAEMIRTFIFPFFMIKLYMLKYKKKNISILLYILVWVYLDYLSMQYIGRYDIVLYAIFTFLLVTSGTSGTRKKFTVSKTQLIIIAVGFILAIPLLLSYRYSRQGISVRDFSYRESLEMLLSVEVMFPKYYSAIEQISSSVSPIGYFLWFILLPIPSVILKNKAELSVIVNRVFTTYILGADYGSSKYYGLLPSIFGEAMLIYNRYFSFLHAIFLALLVGCLCRILDRYPEASVLNLYFAVKLLSLSRGGSQGYFGLVINSLLIYVVCKIVISTKKRKKIRSN